MNPKALAPLAIAALLAGCSNAPPKPKAVDGASERQKVATLDQLKKLAGTWEIMGDDGKPIGETVFAVTSAGSAVREIMFVGQAHEMTNLYHLDGKSIVMTHYCAEGNQPTMGAPAPDSPTGRIAFRFISVANLTRPNQEYMGDMTLIIKDNDHIQQQWQSYVETKPTQHRADFDLVRKKT